MHTSPVFSDGVVGSTGAGGLDDVSMPALVDVLQVERVEEDRFLGSPGPAVDARLFGGQLMAQVLAATAATVHADREPHSLRCTFLRPGLSVEPLEIAVEVVRDGREFSCRQVRVTQQGRLLTLVEVLWRRRVGEDGFSDIAALSARPEPVSHLPFPGRGVVTGGLDLRWVIDDIGASTLWFRCEEPAAPVAFWSQLVWTYVSDLWFAEPLARRLGASFSSEAVRVSTVSHAVWFHGPMDVSRWHALTSHTPVCDAGLGVVQGVLSEVSGIRKSTVIQEALLRHRPVMAAEQKGITT